VGRTYRGGGHVKKVPSIIFHDLVDTVVMSDKEGMILVRRVEVSGVLDRVSSDFTARQRGISKTPPDDP